jgi:hypothetical protein
MMSDNLTPYRPKTGFGSPGGTAQTQGINLAAGILGAGNSVLFGLPEAALKALGGEKQKQIIEAYKAAHPEYGVGETLGNVGSMFIPGGQIAKLASLGGKIAPLAKLGEVAAGAPSITQGLAAAAEQAVPRAFGSQQEGKDIGQRALEAGGQTVLGGILGGTLEGVKYLSSKYIPKELMKEIGEGLDASVVSNVFGKNFTRGLRQTTKNAGGSLAQIDQAEKILYNTANQLEQHGIGNAPDAERLLGDNGSAWKKIGGAMNDAIATGKTPSLAAAPEEMFNHPDMVDAIKYHGDDAALKNITDLTERIKRFADDPANTFVKTRKVLTDAINQGFKSGNTEDIVKADFASAMKNYFDQTAMHFAPEGTDIKTLKELYPSFLAMGKALAREKTAVGPAFSPGSDTFMRTAIDTSMKGGDVIGGLAGAASNVVGAGVNKAVSSIASTTMAEIASKLRKALPRDAEGKPLEIQQMLPPGLAKLLGIANKPITTGTERAGLLPQIVGAGTQQATLTPDQNQQVPTIDRLPAPNFGQTQVQPVTQVQPAQPTPQDILEEKIAQNWDLLTDPNGLIEKGQPGVRQQFIDKVKSQLIDDQGNINYLRAAKALFPGDSASAKSFLDSYQRFATIQKGLSDAVKLQTLGDAQATANKQAVIDATIDTLKKGGMDSKKAEQVITDLLNNPFDNSGTKSAKLLNLLRTYDQIGFGKGGVLERAGVLR